MFGFGNNNQDATTKARARRAGMLRRQKERSPAAQLNNTAVKNEGRTSVKENEKGGDDETFVLGGLCLAVCVVLIIGLGAAMAVGCFMVLRPECMKSLSNRHLEAWFPASEIKADLDGNTSNRLLRTRW